jgi:ACS family glucarate transporter-like MFS transporter
MSVVTYIDRVNISVTARQIMPALGLTDVQMGQVFSAFFLGYALFQVPGGWFGDRFGPKRVLFVAILWWSLFTACTAIAATLPLVGLLGIFGSLLALRFLIGVGESMALPNFNRTVANWSAPSEHGLAISLAIGGIGIGSAVTPPITAWIMVNFGWQVAFYASGGLGLFVAAIWYFYATDQPDQHPGVNAGELAIIEADRTPDGHTDDRQPDSVWALFKYPITSWLCLDCGASRMDLRSGCGSFGHSRRSEQVDHHQAGQSIRLDVCPRVMPFCCSKRSASASFLAEKSSTYQPKSESKAAIAVITQIGFDLCQRKQYVVADADD